ncbi:MAG: hypothetical protein JWR09_4012 [Mucilaginibacter sp.]|nr:hypothetical protein [Mucilaginibacter sp.]
MELTYHQLFFTFSMMFEFFKKKKPVQQDEHNVVGISSGDSTIVAIKQKAQEELWYLIKFMSENEKDEELFRYAIKTRFEEGSTAEHMWVQVSDFNDGNFIGRLANEPSTIKRLKYGDDVQILRDDVEDWILQDFLTNTRVGGFSSEYVRNAKQGK